METTEAETREALEAQEALVARGDGARVQPLAGRVDAEHGERVHVERATAKAGDLPTTLRLVFRHGALRTAVELDPKTHGHAPSTKGVL